MLLLLVVLVIENPGVFKVFKPLLLGSVVSSLLSRHVPTTDCSSAGTCPGVLCESCAKGWLWIDVGNLDSCRKKRERMRCSRNFYYLVCFKSCALVRWFVFCFFFKYKWRIFFKCPQGKLFSLDFSCCSSPHLHKKKSF